MRATMAAAFECAQLAGWARKEQEQDRLFKVGVQAGMKYGELLAKASQSNLLPMSKEMQIGFFIGAAHEAKRQSVHRDVVNGSKGQLEISASLLADERHCSIIR